MMSSKLISVCFVLTMIGLFTECRGKVEKPTWPSITRETKPWTRWWWHGSAVTKEGITAEMEAYQKAGLGGLEITPIYGVHGYEDQFVEYLSPTWVELLMHTLSEAERLNMGIDMATGTGWPFGGPWVTNADASKDINYKIYEVTGGARLQEKVEFIQQPYLRAVGSQVYEVSDNFSTAKLKTPEGNRKEPLMRLDPKAIGIKALVEPVSANKNLQALALDQVKFEKPLPLTLLMAYNGSEVLNLTEKVIDGKLDWTAPSGNWKLYALFEGWHGKMVERAGPGGEGNVIDHFSSVALKNYLARFDSAFAEKDIKLLRSFFNDSYEVDDARGVASWTPRLLAEFRKRRGYGLEEHLPALLQQDAKEKNQRVLCDYRETISELLLENFTQPWSAWAHEKQALVRNQAHGSPANILDLYATVDIPEIEGVEPLRIKMASSAANVTGKKLTSSESATWLNEHFESRLSDIKIALDRFMLNGVNHLFYHGTSYSPPDAPWPGWLFYAAVHLNPRNPQWTDFGALNQYVARCQSLLQNSKADNDILVYYPIYDRFSAPGKELLEHFDSPVKQFENTAFSRAITHLSEHGYSFDYISDKQLGKTKLENDLLITEGSALYKTLIVPQSEFIPLSTMRAVMQLVAEGATVVMFEGFPRSVSGYYQFEEKRNALHSLLNKLVSHEVAPGVRQFQSGKGRILLSGDLDAVLGHAAIGQEKLSQLGLDFIRRKKGEQPLYFISNRDSVTKEVWIPLNAEGNAVVVYNPMTETIAQGVTRRENDKLEVFARLTSRQSIFLEVYEGDVEMDTTPRYEEGKPIALKGPWSVNFESGGPVLPPALQIDSLTSWTAFGSSYESFSGTATYQLRFKKPDVRADAYRIDLGLVKESARVILNGRKLGTLIGPVYEIEIPANEFKEQNVLEIRVSNAMANRIADLDRRGVFWKKFYNINFPARKSENRKNNLFDASAWPPRESGLVGPVTVYPLKMKDE